MFDYIKGILAAKTQSKKTLYYTVEVGGIGYLIEVCANDFNKKEVNEEVKIYTVLIHREDTMNLCGFLNKEARDIFSILTTVSGVGVKMALGLVNEFEVSELIYLVINENSKGLTKAKGVGQKLAQKIILELKDKLINLSPEFSENKIIDAPAGTEEIQKILLSLGYEEDEITSAIKQACILGENPNNSEEFLRSTLQILSAI